MSWADNEHDGQKDKEHDKNCGGLKITLVHTNAAFGEVGGGESANAAAPPARAAEAPPLLFRHVRLPPGADPTVSQLKVCHVCPPPSPAAPPPPFPPAAASTKHLHNYFQAAARIEALV
eukprot:SAG22_NODE_287_length_12963_cov_21.279086_4_plen_119_part_00